MDLISAEEIKRHGIEKAEVHLYEKKTISHPVLRLFVSVRGKKGYLASFRGEQKSFSKFETLRKDAVRLGITELKVSMKVRREEEQLSLI